MKNIIICADGTWNTTEMTPQEGVVTASNVSLLATMVETEDDHHPQQVYYMEGVGTSADDKLSGGLYGWGLMANVIRAYRYLCYQYEEGDRLYFFGFSRGAYTVRSLAGLIKTSGILRISDFGWNEDKVTELIEQGVQLYKEKTDPNKDRTVRASIFRRQHCHEPKVHFVGCWDTVGAMGVPSLKHRLEQEMGWDWQFHDMQLGDHISYAYHALALHERRAPFAPTLWYQNPEKNTHSHLTQMWFVGGHADIGGGNVNDDFSAISRDWMAQMAEKRGLILRPAPRKALKQQAEDVVATFPQRHNDSYASFYAIADLLRKESFKPFRQFRTGESHGDFGETFEYIHDSVLPYARRFQRWDETAVPQWDQEEEKDVNWSHRFWADDHREILRTEAHPPETQQLFYHTEPEGKGLERLGQWQRVPAVAGTAEQHEVRVYASYEYSFTGLLVHRDAQLRFTTAPGSEWDDYSVQCGAEGWHSKTLLDRLIHAIYAPFTRSRKFSRQPNADQARMFELCASLTKEPDMSFPVGIERNGDGIYNVRDYLPEGAGTYVPLYLFANDLPGFYNNNRGYLTVSVECW